MRDEIFSKTTKKRNDFLPRPRSFRKKYAFTRSRRTLLILHIK
ncbi:hypothetical protein CP10139811_0555 [Chlamydia ibidis]|uniref:Uncharacterized protein n=1 Tax=Chlamydia ibidis TaxID=1405396 RepID=S7KJ47_9CHLA|nr:hypothetical protein CP10139811_0555 [Chlamydia ibidis]